MTNKECKHESLLKSEGSGDSYWCPNCGAVAHSTVLPRYWHLPITTKEPAPPERSILIAAEGVSRKITGPYSICGSRFDLQRLCVALKQELDGDFNFGWIDVVEKPARAHVGPLPWGKS